MKKHLAIGALTISSIIALPASATTLHLDMSTWITEGRSNWSYDANSNSWTQNSNLFQTVLYDPNQSSINSALGGSISVGQTNDDDWIGFVLGFQSGELSSSDTDGFWLVDWKRADQGSSRKGLTMYQVTDPLDNAFNRDVSDGYREVARGTTLGTVGWELNTPYDFNILFDANLIEVYINDLLEISITASEAGVSQFNDGSFGFYNYSQDKVTYSDPFLSPVEDVVSEERRDDLAGPTSVSEPGTIAIMSAALFGLMRLRRKK